MYLHYDFEEFGIEYDADCEDVRKVILQCICEEIREKYVPDTPLGEMAEWIYYELGDDYFEEKYEAELLDAFEEDARRQYNEMLEEEKEQKYLEEDYWRSQF